MGILLSNLGTPDAPESGPVRRYLREFLSDPRVLDIHPVGRWLLLNFVILPVRPAKSAEAYQKIWSKQGSPLLFHSQGKPGKLEIARFAARPTPVSSIPPHHTGTSRAAQTSAIRRASRSAFS